MAVLIKNQILKHLSKFTKNLSPDKLHLSTLKGHGELSNLELNEKVLTELLELPAWLRLTRATCNYVTLKIHWTKLKSVPIHLSLDEVIVVVETCEDLRPPTPMSSEHSYNSGGKYGFSDRVIDGMTVAVNSVLINFSSPAFQASFQLSRVVLESYSPDWKKKDLRLSRIKDIDRGELLLFKRLEWQMLRIEAKSKDNSANGIKRDIPLTPLRLITNQACCKITIKKKLSDCTVVGSRLVFVLDDLLWVLTDAQLVAALHFVQSLSGLVQKATQLTQKQKAKKKLEQQPDRDLHQSKSSTRFSPVFNRNDVIETSYHVLCSRIDLHLCDDMDPQDGRSQHPDLRDGGALQVSLHKLVVDYYPYHRAFSSKDHWLRYTEPSSSHNAWVQQLLSLFYEKFLARGFVPFPSDGSLNKIENTRHTSVYRVSSLSSSASGENQVVSPSSPENKSFTRKASSTSTNSDIDSSRKSATSRKLSLQHNYRCLMSSCFILRLEDIVAYKVSISKSTAAKKKHAIEKFLIYNKGAHLPSEIKTIHLEHVTYYLPGDIDYPVPSPNFFFYLGPLKLSLDTATVLWINAFYLNLQKCLMSLKLDTYETPSLANIRVEALMPQVVIPSDQTSPTQPDRPRTLQMQASRIVATNCRVGEHASKSHLEECLNILTFGNAPFDKSQFPWHADDKRPISEAFMKPVQEDYDASPTKSVSTKEIISECTDIWSIHLDPFWSEFTICESGRTRLQSFIDPLPITLWFHNSEAPSFSQKPLVNKISEGFERMTLHGLKPYCVENADVSEIEASGDVTEDVLSKNEANIYVLVHVHSLLNIQLTHFQYLFVLRAMDIMVDLTEHLEIDTAAIIKDKPVLAMCVTTWWPQVEVSLVLRSLNQLSATSDSVDLASLQDDCSSNSDIPVTSKTKLLQSQSSFSVNDCCRANAKPCSPENEKSCGGILEDCCIENGLPKSCSDSLLNCHSPGSSRTPTTSFVEGISEIQGVAEINSPYKGLHSGTSAMKRGFCSLVASIDSAFAKTDIPSFDNDSISYPDEDTLSLKSDLSCDLDQFVLLNQDGALEDEFFPHPHAIEVADEAKEDTISNYTLNSEKKKEMISVAAFKFSKVAFVMHSQLATCLVIQCNHIETKEESAISWENFQNLFSTRSRSWKIEKDCAPNEDCELSMRITQEATPASNRASPEPKFLTVSAQNLHLQFYMSSVSALVDFFEDEVAAKSMPSKIILSNLNIQLQDDGSNPGMSPSSSIPLNISLPGCILERTLKGTLSVLPLPDGYVQQNLNALLSQKMNMSPSSNTLSYSNVPSPHAVRKHEHCNSKCHGTSSSDCDTGHGQTALVLKLLKDNDDLKSKLVEMFNLQQENESLKRELQTLQGALSDGDVSLQLLESKKEIRRLEDEKRTLQETLQVLQKDLNRLETKNMCDFTK